MPTAAHYQPTLLGVLNVSPESMVGDSIARSDREILRRAELLTKAGAAFIDLGARAITPYAPTISDSEERDRLLPALALLKRRGYRVSVDTWSPETASAALEWGADFLNFTGAELPRPLLWKLRASGIPVVLTYMPYGDAYRMRSAEPVRYSVAGICSHLAPRIREARDHGIDDPIVDPNLGIIHPATDDYSKIQLQLDVVWNLDSIRSLGCRVLLYAARKPERLARLMMAAAVLKAQPDYIRTHYPEMIERMMQHQSL